MSGAAPRLSVIIVSWQRLDSLRLCLLALTQQDHPEMELVLVLDPAALGQIRQELAAGGLTARLAENPGANISVARNIGLAAASGEVVAFIDDDAVPEPSWARRIAQAFEDAQVVAATGHVLGRNGISLQWGGVEVDATGQDHPIPPWNGLETRLFRPQAQRAVKPVGTNCAFRADVLRQIGGFDPAYRFYLEDADIGLRLAGRGMIAVVPGALVHHGFAASDRRRGDRVPLDLGQIGASTQVFLRRHAAPQSHASALARLRAEQADRLARHLAAGRLSQAEARHLNDGLEAGITEGAARALPALAALNGAAPGFVRLSGTGPRPGLVLSGRFWQARRLRAKAALAARQGQIVTLFLLAPSLRAHRMRFDPQGFWLQEGGLFGRSIRQGPRLVLARFARRIQQEIQRIRPFRPC